MGIVARAWKIGLVTAVPALSGCILANGKPISIEQASYTPAASAPRLRAGVAEVDVTPPPGLPSYGYSTNGVADMRGYWLRLKARIIVLEQPLVERPPDGDEKIPTVDEGLLVLVQADFGASSALIHRGIAARLGGRGVSPANLVFATTHTHGGPGGMFQDKFFNKSVGARPLFVPQYVEFVVAQIADGIERALADVHPAQIGFAEATAPTTATFNRSYDAWERNALDLGRRPDPSRSVDRTLRLLRVDTDRAGNGSFSPEGVFSVFAVHGTSMPASYGLYHGDVHGLAARLGAHRIRRDYPASTRFVAATATGAEGDVSPGKTSDAQGKDLTMDVAAAEAATMVRAFHSLDGEGKLSDAIRFSYAYHEASMRGASTSRGKLCDEGALGAAELAGSEVSQGPLTGFLEMSEGAHRGFDGCQQRKIKFLGDAQDLFYLADEYPDTVPFQIVRFAGPKLDVTDADGTVKQVEPPSLVLASFPGEPTTGVGEMVATEIQKTYPRANVATVGLTNSYATYFTTPSEYAMQHYEGGTTFYGPYQGVFGAEQLGLLAASLERTLPARSFLTKRTFQAGEPATGVWPKGACNASEWKAVDRPTFDLVKRPGSDGTATLIAFHWSGAKPDQRCALPAVSLECMSIGEKPDSTPEPWSDDRGWPVTDEGFDFEVFDAGNGAWTASWTRHGETPEDQRCWFVVEDTSARSASTPNERVRWITSEGFRLDGKR